MFSPIPVTVGSKDESSSDWHADRPLFELLQILDALELSSVWEVRAGAIERLRLDSTSRRKDDNKIRFRGSKPQGDLEEKLSRNENRIQCTFRINKGLAMELTVSSILTFFGHPRTIRSYCTTNAKGLPNNFAPCGVCDIEPRPVLSGTAFQIVCEVSANRNMNETAFLRQLAGAYKHCEAVHKPRKRGFVTYGFLVNHGDIGESKELQQLYLGFLKRKKLRHTSRIRLVPMLSRDFGTAMLRLREAKHLSFDSSLFARALDVLHEGLRGNVPDREEWMAEDFVQAIADGASANPSLLNPPQARALQGIANHS